MVHSPCELQLFELEYRLKIRKEHRSLGDKVLLL